MNDLARTKPEEICVEVFTHGETMLPSTMIVKPRFRFWWAA